MSSHFFGDMYKNIASHKDIMLKTLLVAVPKRILAYSMCVQGNAQYECTRTTKKLANDIPQFSNICIASLGHVISVKRDDVLYMSTMPKPLSR